MTEQVEVTEQPQTTAEPSSWRFLVVMIIFVGFLGLFYWALSHDSSELPSQLINQPVPDFEVSELLDPAVIYSPEIFKGKTTLLNVWASWCAACYTEHPYWAEYAKNPDLQIIGLNYNDKKQAAMKFLNTQGNPYEKILFDKNGRLGIEFGVYGAPETFLVGPQGKVRYRHVGIVSPEVYQNKLLPLIKKIEQGF